MLKSKLLDFRGKFKIVKSKDFKPACFSFHPLWSEYYDFDELDEIKSWGLDLNKQEILDALMKKEENGSHPHYTVPIEVFPPSRMRYFTKATFTTQNGYKLKGAIMNEGEMVIIIFLSMEEDVRLSKHPIFKNERKKRLTRIAKRFNIEIEELYKLRFETEITDQKGNNISGIYNLNKNEQL